MKEKLNKRMRQGRVVIDKESGKDAGQKKGMVKLQRVLASGRWHAPPALQRVAQGCHLCLIWEVADTSCTSCWLLQSAGCQTGVAGRRRGPGPQGTCCLPSLCVVSPTQAWPQGFCGKGQSLLEHVSAPLSVAAAVAGCFIVSRCRLLSLLTGNCTQLQQGKESLSYLTCKGYLNENFKLLFILS